MPPIEMTSSTTNEPLTLLTLSLPGMELYEVSNMISLVTNTLNLRPEKKNRNGKGGRSIGLVPLSVELIAVKHEMIKKEVRSNLIRL